MAVRIERGVFRTENSPKIESFASVVGGKEGKGPLGKYFDKIVENFNEMIRRLKKMWNVV